MIAARIARGETAEQIGIAQDSYDSRKELVDRYIAETGADFTPRAYLGWLKKDAAGDRGDGGSGRQTTVVIGKRDKGCGCGSKRQMPSKGRMAKSLLGEAAKFARAGFKTVDQQAYRDRLAICEACPEYTDAKRCRVCGCFMTAKAKMATTDCALGRWPKNAKDTQGAKPKTEIV